MSELGENMTQSNEPTIEYKNAIIAQFMGYKRVEVGYSGTEEETEWQRNNEEWMNKVGITLVGRYFVDVPNDEWVPCDDIHYHDSWDACMPVIKKIREMHADLLLTLRNGVSGYIKAAGEMNKGLISCDIAKAHTGVYNLLTWLNQQTTTNEITS